MLVHMQIDGKVKGGLLLREAEARKSLMGLINEKIKWLSSPLLGLIGQILDRDSVICEQEPIP